MYKKQYYKSKILQMKKHFSLYLIAAPGLVFFFIMSYIPMVFLFAAFQKYSAGLGFFGSPFAGLANFKALFTDRLFPMILKNTLILNAMKIILTFPMPIILALAFNEMKPSLLKKFCQSTVYLPHFLSWIVIYSIMISLMNVNTGMINKFIMLLGGTPISFLTNKNIYKIMMVFMEIWKEAGWGSIIYIAALTTISGDLYEAAIIDGANKWRRTWYVSLPGIRNTMLLLFILSISTLMSGSFEQVFVTKNPAVYDVAEIIPTFVYTKGLIQMNTSYGIAVGLFQSMIGFILVVSANYLSKLAGEEGIW
jgi:putative aldouronate transport system permease protein